MKRNIWGPAVAMSLAAALLAVGCSSPEPTTAPTTPPPTTGEETSGLDELYQEALAAGQTTITVYGPSEAQWEPFYQAFSERFPGINVVGEFLFGGELEARLQQEVATGQHVADLVHFDDAVRYADIMTPFELVDVDTNALPAGVEQFDGKLYMTSRALYGFAYTPGSVSAADVPKSWADLADFPGIIGMSNPTSLAATASVLYQAYEAGAIDDAWLTSLAARPPVIYQSSSQMAAGLSVGEFDLSPVTFLGFYLTQKGLGADLEFLVPEDGAALTSSPYGLLAGAPSPLAANLLISFQLTEEGQRLVVEKAQSYPVLPGMPAPAGMPTPEQLNLLPMTPGEQHIAKKSEAVAKMKEFFE